MKTILAAFSALIIIGLLICNIFITLKNSEEIQLNGFIYSQLNSFLYGDRIDCSPVNFLLNTSSSNTHQRCLMITPVIYLSTPIRNDSFKLSQIIYKVNSSILHSVKNFTYLELNDQEEKDRLRHQIEESLREKPFFKEYGVHHLDFSSFIFYD